MLIFNLRINFLLDGLLREGFIARIQCCGKELCMGKGDVFLLQLRNGKANSLLSGGEKLIFLFRYRLIEILLSGKRINLFYRGLVVRVFSSFCAVFCASSAE